MQVSTIQMFVAIGLLILAWRLLPAPDWHPMSKVMVFLPAFLEEVGLAEWNRVLDEGGRWGNAVAELSGRFPHRRELIEAAHLRWHEMLPGAIDGTVTILEQLAAKETPLYAITNYSS